MEDLEGCIPRLTLMTQVFGNIIETIIKEEHPKIDYDTLKTVFKEYCKINSELELDMLSRYCMNNPKDLKKTKVDGSKVVGKFNQLISNTTIYTEEDFTKTIKQIEDHPVKEHKNELFTIMQMFANKNGCTPEMLLSVIKGSKIEFDRK